MKTLKIPAQGKVMKKVLQKASTVAYKGKGKMTQAQDDASDRRAGRKEGSPADIAQDRRNGIKDKKKKKATGAIKHTGKFNGKSNALGQGGRAAQMRARGVPAGVIGNIARREHAAPGQSNYHKRGKK